MTAFNTTFLFLRDPHGGVESLDEMKAAGFAGVFVNIGDFPLTEWALIRQRAAQQGMFCGPWARTGQGPGTFNPAVLETIITVADAWQSPLIVNSEAELANTGATLTTMIAKAIGTRDGAISMEPWLFPNVDWGPVAHLPMLLQINPAENDASKRPADCAWHAHQLGCRCVYFTFGTAPPMNPSIYVLQSPYSLYTGDNAGPNFKAWSPTGTGFDACESPVTATEARKRITATAKEWEDDAEGAHRLTRVTTARRITQAGNTDARWKGIAEKIAKLLDQAGVPN